MNVVLTHAYYLSEDAREARIMKPYVPLGILSISSYLEQNGIENNVIDTTFSDFATHCGDLADQRPDIVGIYTNLMTRLNVLRLIRFIRSSDQLRNTRIILGGPEVRYSAEKLIRAGADFIVNGEGEQTMLELTRHLLSGQSGFGHIKGIVFEQDGQIITNPEREKMKDLDELPFPARGKVDMQLYFDAWKSKHGQSAISVSTMRGCPYTCRWCSRAVYGQSYRRRSPQKVVEELAQIQRNYKVDTVWFVDDVFTVSHKWLHEFRDRLAESGHKFSYECITRADRMNEEVISLLKETGCFRVWIGAESGSQRIIDAMDRRVDVAQVREMIIKSRKAGLQAGTFIMVGYPGETEADIRETLEHLKISEPDQYTITVTYPIRGTPLFEETMPMFTAEPAWEEGTDRDIDFRRTYSRKYYQYAIRWITNAMHAHKLRNRPDAIAFRIWYSIKSIAARGCMAFERKVRHS